jgi:glucose dehydrogenase
VGSQLAVTEYATKDTYFVNTTQFYTPPGFSLSFLSAVDKTTGAEKWRITYGSGQSSYDTTNNVTQAWNNKLLIKKIVFTGAGKYGVNSADSHWLIDINTGLTKLKIDDGNKGLTVANYIVGNTMYFNKRFESTLTGLPFGSTSPPANYFFAIDLSTGKQKWNNDKLFANYTGGVSSCVLVGDKGYSSNIQ